MTVEKIPLELKLNSAQHNNSYVELMIGLVQLSDGF